MAKQLIDSVLAADPAGALQEAVPGASPELLSNLRLDPMRMAGVNAAEGSFDDVHVQCSVNASLSDEVATQLVEACEALLQGHLDRVQTRESAAQQGAAADTRQVVPIDP